MLTKWEIGQELIAISDFICEKKVKFRENGHSELSAKLNEIQAVVGDLFNEANDHSFGIFDSSDLRKKEAK